MFEYDCFVIYLKQTSMRLQLLNTWVTFRKSVDLTSLVQNFKKNVNKLIDSKCFVAQFLLTHFFLSCWTNDVTNFPKVMKLMSPLILVMEKSEKGAIFVQFIERFSTKSNEKG